MSIGLILIVLAIILFVLAAAGVASRIQLGWAGMACLALAALIGSYTFA